MMLDGHLFKGILCAFLQATLIGWIPASIWAAVLKNQEAVKPADEYHHEIEVAIQATQVPA